MNQLQKYTWLIDTIRRAGKISHKDIPHLHKTMKGWIKDMYNLYKND